MSKSKIRLDDLLVERGLCVDLKFARSTIMTGVVSMDGKKMDKVGALVDVASHIEIKNLLNDYVSRGGLKLAHALRKFDVDVHGAVCVDVGSSTGGFTDCLLKNGAQKVYAVDVGYGLLDSKLRRDERVVVLERTNIRDLSAEKIPDSIDLAVIDVSFIGLEKVFPKVEELAPKNIIALIKPQFELKPKDIGKGGIVRDEAKRQEAIEAVKRAAEHFNWKFQSIIESPIKGQKGNVEFLAYWTR